MVQQKLEFWFEFASTYSYLTAMRVPVLARAHGVAVTWRPFLLGPIFKAQGWDTSPFLIYPQKGRYMWRDVARRADRVGLAFRRPVPFPQNGLLAARVAHLALSTPQGVGFCQAVFRAQFAQGKDISDPAVIATCACQSGLPEGMLAQAKAAANKAALRATTTEAMQRGIFGAPAMTVGDELFWGDDRLEDALDWAIRSA